MSIDYSNEEMVKRIEELEEKVKISAVYIMISLSYILYTIIKQETENMCANVMAGVAVAIVLVMFVIRTLYIGDE